MDATQTPVITSAAPRREHERAPLLREGRAPRLAADIPSLVHGADGAEVGSARAVTIDPLTGAIAHLVVGLHTTKHRGTGFGDRLVPAGWVSRTAAGETWLDHSAADVAACDPLHHYALVEDGFGVGIGDPMFYGAGPMTPITVAVPDVPTGLVELLVGTTVYDTDDRHIGRLHSVVQDGEGRVVELLLHHHGLHRHIVVPIASLVEADETQIIVQGI